MSRPLRIFKNKDLTLFSLSYKGENRSLNPGIREWFYSAPENAIYYFGYDEESNRFDSLWRIESSGKNLSNVLDGWDSGGGDYHTHDSWSANGDKLIYWDSLSGTLTNGLPLVNTKTKESIRILADIVITSFAMSPDGEKIAYVSESELNIYDMGTGRITEVYALN